MATRLTFLEYLRIQQFIGQIPLQQGLPMQSVNRNVGFRNIQQNLNYFSKEVYVLVVH